MTYWSAILLGIIQGLAEFLPISSSGHLAILQNFLRIGDLENQMLFDVLLHLGTLGAVILAYHTELRGLCREGLAMLHIKKLRRGVKPDLPRRRLLLFLIAATLPLIPAALLNDWLDPLFYNTFFHRLRAHRDRLSAAGGRPLRPRQQDREGHDALGRDHHRPGADDRRRARPVPVRDDDLRRAAARV